MAKKQFSPDVALAFARKKQAVIEELARNNQAYVPASTQQSVEKARSYVHDDGNANKEALFMEVTRCQDCGIIQNFEADCYLRGLPYCSSCGSKQAGFRETYTTCYDCGRALSLKKSNCMIDNKTFCDDCAEQYVGDLA